MLQGSEVAIYNLHELFDTSILAKRGIVSTEDANERFLAVYDPALVVKFNDKCRNYHWWLFQCNQMHLRNATWTQLDAEPLDNWTFDFQMVLHQDGLDRPVHWHTIAWVHPETSKIVRLRFLSGEAASRLFAFNERNAIVPTTSDSEDEFDSDCSVISSSPKHSNKTSSVTGSVTSDIANGIFGSVTSTSITKGIFDMSTRSNSKSEPGSVTHSIRRRRIPRSLASRLFNSNCNTR
eukprot:jgi/Psemu1/310253/fgenesh1_kg.610_\